MDITHYISLILKILFGAGSIASLFYGAIMFSIIFMLSMFVVDTVWN